MKRLFVDANVFLRFFTGDDRSQHGSAEKLFREAATGDASLVTGPPVLFEIAWTLRSAYDLPREKVLDVLSRIASLPGLELADGPVVEEAISVAKTSGKEFADSYILASSRRLGAVAVATFNRKDFLKMGATLHPF
jgi:predicted nucleic acid-binding protein